MTAGGFRRSLRRGRRGPGYQDVWASVDGMPAVVLTVPGPEMFVMIDGLAVRAVPETGTALPGDRVQIRYDHAAENADADTTDSAANATPITPAISRLVAS